MQNGLHSLEDTGKKEVDTLKLSVCKHILPQKLIISVNGNQKSKFKIY